MLKKTAIFLGVFFTIGVIGMSVVSPQTSKYVYFFQGYVSPFYETVEYDVTGLVEGYGQADAVLLVPPSKYSGTWNVWAKDLTLFKKIIFKDSIEREAYSYLGPNSDFVIWGELPERKFHAFKENGILDSIYDYRSGKPKLIYDRKTKVDSLSGMDLPITLLEFAGFVP